MTTVHMDGQITARGDAYRGPVGCVRGSGGKFLTCQLGSAFPAKACLSSLTNSTIRAHARTYEGPAPERQDNSITSIR
jgi:hypothetical protein